MTNEEVNELAHLLTRAVAAAGKLSPFLVPEATRRDIRRGLELVQKAIVALRAR